ncbi:MAG: LacI family DNA-binding transcriptional regulator [Clostridia bacterium]|nr:LacI family DNA-binding transcriptional regulator [Clostridia bacterium]
MGNERVKLKDIASACGYTVNTVSRALRNDERLPASTRAQIREKARELGYIRNSMASALRSGKSHTVAVIVNDLHNLHFCNMLSKMDRSLRQAGYNMMILCMQLNEALGDQLIRTAISHSVDGILYFPYHNNQSHIEYMEKNGVPFVLLDRWIQNVVTDSVRCDDRQGGRLAGEHLAHLGHRRFLFLSGVNQSSSQIDRLDGFLEAIRDYGCTEENVRIVPGEDVEQALEAMEIGKLLYPLDYTAIVCFRDEIAYPTVSALMEHGYTVPRDISVISFDHLCGETPYLPRITSIYTAQEDVATRGVQLLLNRIANPGLPPQVVILPVRVFDEGTTAPMTKGSRQQ